MKLQRRQTREVFVGNVGIGGNYPISIQSMTKFATKNVDANIRQIIELVENGCEIVRLAVATSGDVKSFAEIKSDLRRKGINVPLVADVHFSSKVAMECLEIADKVRINPGNFSDKLIDLKNFTENDYISCQKRSLEKLKNFFLKSKIFNKPVRVGVNFGSLAPRIVYKFGNTELAMWESAKECLIAAEEANFHNLILSFKTSDVSSMVLVNRLACKETDKLGYNCPIHLGVTESGDGNYGRVKSSIGIGTLLLSGIGDTIRVSLTENPINEITVAREILQSCGRRRFSMEVISCPSCGRTKYDIQAVIRQIKSEINKFDKNLKIAVMGCIVNGLGEAGNADIAVIGNSNGMLSVYKGNICIDRNISPGNILGRLLEIVKIN